MAVPRSYALLGSLRTNPRSVGLILMHPHARFVDSVHSFMCRNFRSSISSLKGGPQLFLGLMYSQEACRPALDTHSLSYERSKLHRLSILYMFNSPVPKFPDFPQPSPLHLHSSDFPATPDIG